MTRVLSGFSVVAAVTILGVGIASASNALQIVNQEVLSDRDRPEVCMVADRSFAANDGVVWTDYLRIEPQPVGFDVRSQDNRLCATGLAHGTTYSIELRDGAPAADGTVLASSVDIEAYIADRTPTARFDSDGHILPLGLGRGIPLTTVNADQASLRLLRIDPRNIPTVSDEWILYGDLNRWSVEAIAEEDGETVWAGSMSVDQTERNRPASTIVPVGDILEDFSPGLYLLTASIDDNQEADWVPVATQWFVATDTGLTTMASDAGLHVAATSLRNNTPLSDIELTLVARNNRVLGTATTDANGMAQFAPGLMRGTGGAEPGMLHALNGETDFAFLDLRTSGHDLLDRGGDGRPAPADLDGFAFTDRGLYRPGEPIILSVLLRDPAGRAVTGLPLTVTTINPVRNEFDQRIVHDTDGGYRVAIDLPATAPTGGWTLEVAVGDDGPVVAEANVFVSDFVPPQIDVDVDARRIVASDGASAIEADIRADFFFGAPASDLSGLVEVLVQAAETPFPAYPDFRFGLEQVPFLPEQEEPATILLDADGRATATIFHQPRPLADRPLEAVVTAWVDEPGGRSARDRTTVPLHEAPLYVGIRPDREGAWDIDDVAGFSMLAVDTDGAPMADVEVTYDLYREEYDYVWYREYGSWYAEQLVTDTRVGGGTVTTGDDGMARVDESVDWGRYRIEAYPTAVDGTESSVRFAAGYWGTGEEQENADNVTVSLDSDDYRPGDTAEVLIETPYPESELIVAVADRSIRSFQRVSAPDGTARLEIPVSDDWENGAYVLVTAIASADSVSGPLPRRAVGLRWIGLDPAPATLNVALDAPDMVRPQTEVPVSLALTDSNGDPAGGHVILAAVDDAVLGLTDHSVPDPLGHAFGQRRAAVAIRDLFGNLIDPTGDRVGTLRTGGDWALDDPEGLPDPSIEVAAWVSEILTADADGRIEATLPVPDFNGRLRLTAVAWSPEGLGAADSDMTVRAPVVANLVLPRFLAVGDRAEATLQLRNLDGPAGDYSLTLDSDGAVALPGPDARTLSLGEGEVWTDTLELRADLIGNTAISLRLEGPDGLLIERHRSLGVRSAHPPETRSLLSEIPVGGGLTLSDDITAGFLPDTTRVTQVLGSGPTIDIPALTAQLADYPFACIEQTTSRAFPLLVLADGPFAPALAGLETPRQAVQQAIFRVAAQQSSTGAFSLWGAGGPESLWLTAYVSDFLLEAAKRDFTVPGAPLSAALSWIEQQTANVASDSDILDAQLYGLYVLTMAGRDTLADLRYIFEARLDQMQPGVGLAALAAALAEQGDRTRAAQVIDRATAPEIEFAPSTASHASRRDYGSPLRDQAALVALTVGESDMPDGTLDALWADIAADISDNPYPNTQELAWSLRAASAAMADQGPLSVTIGSDSVVDRLTPITRTVDPDLLRQGFRIENRGEAPVSHRLTIRGLPKAAPSATQAGATLYRDFYSTDGTPVDFDGMSRGQTVVMVLSGQADSDRIRDLVVAQWLPAGWEAEDLRLTGDTIGSIYPWIGRVTPTVSVDIRDDRVVAAPDPYYAPDNPAEAGFRLAFLLRAVTPGTYTLPGAYVEDMYDPAVHARLAGTTIVVE